MTDDRSLERAARSWLEEGPARAPDRAVEAALLQIQTTDQERDWHVPWRTRSMTQTSRVLAGVAAIAIVLVGGVLILRPGGNTGIGGPSPSPSAAASPSVTPTPSAASGSNPSATPLPTSKTFTSTRFGYSVVVPFIWATRHATIDWTDSATNSWGSDSVDELQEGGTVRLSVSSRPLPSGTTPDAMLQSMADSTPACTKRDPAPATVPIGAATGTLIINGCPSTNPGAVNPQGVVYTVGVVAGGRAYYFILDGLVGPADLQALLATVTLQPAAATDAATD